MASDPLPPTQGATKGFCTKRKRSRPPQPELREPNIQWVFCLIHCIENNTGLLNTLFLRGHNKKLNNKHNKHHNKQTKHNSKHNKHHNKH